MDEGEDVERYQWDRTKEEIELFGVMRPVGSWLEPVMQYEGFYTVLKKIGRVLARGFDVIGIASAIVVGPGWTTATRKRTLHPPVSQSSRLRVKRPFNSTVVAVYFFLQFVASLMVAVPGLFTAQQSYWPAAYSMMFSFALNISLGLFLDRHPHSTAVHVLLCTAALTFFLPYWCTTVLRAILGLSAAVVARVQLALSALEVAGLVLCATGRWSDPPTKAD